MDKVILNNIEMKFPCRHGVLESLSQFVGNSVEAYPSCIYIYGHSGTGKTIITKEFLNQYSIKSHDKLKTAYVNCVEIYTTRILLESILELLLNFGICDKTMRCDCFKDFVQILAHFGSPQHTKATGYIVVIDNAERLRDMDANVLPYLMRLQEITKINICVILISQLPFEKYYSKTGLSEVIILHFAQYTKNETLRILSTDFKNVCTAIRLRQATANNDSPDKFKLSNITIDLYNNFLNLFLSVFYNVCRDIYELKVTARKSFLIYIRPILDGCIDARDISRLWRHIVGPLKTFLLSVYMRIEQTQQESITVSNDSLLDQTVRKIGLTLEMPYYGKYLLVAAFLASYNSAKEDKRLYVKHHGKQRKRIQSINANTKVADKMSIALGPKSFSIDRLLAIFYAILDEKVGLTCNLLSQISTLIHLKLLSLVSGENNVMDGSTRLQCTVSIQFVLYISKTIAFNVRQYICDFM